MACNARSDVGPMTANQIQLYLERIKFSGSQNIDYETLVQLHEQHLLTVPFENLDVFYGKRIVMNLDALYQKIVVNKRGGWCHELNGLFHHLLLSMGFETRLVSVHVDIGGVWTHWPHPHAAIFVKAFDKPGKYYYVDVGFGRQSAIFTPVLLEPDVEYEQPTGYIKFQYDSEERAWIQWIKDSDNDSWNPSLKILEDGCCLEDFQKTADDYREGKVPEAMKFCKMMIVNIKSDHGYVISQIVGRYLYKYVYSKDDKHTKKKDDSILLSPKILKKLFSSVFGLHLKEDIPNICEMLRE